ncbi:hypothetical protein [Parafrankia elaeagni]|uniref:hypothetical protein n=1 Tax=Parafrankia elaeagni TaxID=222534 RepID=UPI00036E32B6|nr:hypothetical protein [Parafrankia elaeagni]
MTVLASFLIIGALVCMVVGVIALIRGRFLRARITNRRTAAGVTVAALVAFAVGGGLLPSDEVDGEETAAVAAASVPSARPSPLVTVTPPQSGTATPTPTAVTPTAPPTTQAPVPQAPPTTAAGRPAAQPTVQAPAAAAGQPPAANPPAAAAPPAAAQAPPAAAQAPPPAAPPAQQPAANPRTGCEPSYPDVCLRSGIGDYDCEGGRGNGPNYVRGPLRVTPPDPFDLDSDGDGRGCVS